MKSLQSTIITISLITGLILSLSISALSQDRLYYYSGESVVVKILEETKTTITFVPFEQQDVDPLIIDKAQIRRIYYKDKKAKKSFTFRYNPNYTFGDIIAKLKKERAERKAHLKQITENKTIDSTTQESKKLVESEKKIIVDKSKAEKPNVEEKTVKKATPIPIPEQAKDTVETNKYLFNKKTSPREITQQNVPYKDAFKINLSSIPLNTLEVGFEWRIRKKISFELSGGVIGLGLPGDRWSSEWDQISNSYNENGVIVFHEKGRIGQAGGFLLKAGPKFTFNQINSLTGWYVRPEFTYVGYEANGYAKYNYPSDPDLEANFTWNYSNHQVGILVNLGYQFLLGNRCLLDFNGGIGYMHPMENLKITGDYRGQLAPYKHTAIPNIYQYDNDLEYQYGYFASKNLTINASLKLGIFLNPSID